MKTCQLSVWVWNLTCLHIYSSSSHFHSLSFFLLLIFRHVKWINSGTWYNTETVCHLARLMDPTLVTHRGDNQWLMFLYVHMFVQYTWIWHVASGGYVWWKWRVVSSEGCQRMCRFTVDAHVFGGMHAHTHTHTHTHTHINLPLSELWPSHTPLMFQGVKKRWKKHLQPNHFRSFQRFSIHVLGVRSEGLLSSWGGWTHAVSNPTPLEVTQCQRE